MRQDDAVIAFGPMSITLLICTVQGLVLAALLLRAAANRTANINLALLILGVALLITPYTIGYAGFYDRYPWLSFAPFSYTLAFGPLIYRYTCSLTGAARTAGWPHFVPVIAQFLADALVFPFPLPMKNTWNSAVNAPILSPLFETTALVSIAVYGIAAWRRYRAYRVWLAETRSDGVDFDPGWIRNFLIALALTAIIWTGFEIANAINPARNYFDQFGLYLWFSALVLYLGIEGWRHAGTAFPRPEPASAPPPEEAPAPQRDWAALGAQWLARIDAERLWQDPDISLASLARHLGTNTAYLSRALNAAAHENFNAIINRRRVRAVQARLASGDCPRDMMTLAFDAGFRSKASFNRAFADFAGMSPSAWRLKSQKTLPAA